ncbi:bacteriophage tail completion protein S [Pseudoduganella dura]|nr:bacteriophage tail completion protein S [Pseudoduganella dura]
MDNLEALEQWAGAALARLEPAERRKIAMDVGRELRRNQQRRIASQRNPDGSPYDPRKPRQVQQVRQGGQLRERRGRIKRQAMFVKLRTARMMKVETDSAGVTIGFAGRVARIARVHQEGEESEVEPGRNKYRYPIRQLLGLDQAGRDMIRDRLLEHLAR